MVFERDIEAFAAPGTMRGYAYLLTDTTPP